MEEFKAALRGLTKKVCCELEGQEIPKKPVWTVVDWYPAGGRALSRHRRSVEAAKRKIILTWASDHG